MHETLETAFLLNAMKYTNVIVYTTREVYDATRNTGMHLNMTIYRDNYCFSPGSSDTMRIFYKVDPTKDIHWRRIKDFPVLLINNNNKFYGKHIVK